MWAGAKVHDCINHTLTNLQRGISVLDVDQIVDITLNQMREEFRSSREKRYLTHPKTCALFEHEYELPISDAEWKKTADNMEQCLRNFYSSETFSMLKELPQQMWLEVEDFSSFNLNNTKIWAVLDCSFRTDDGGVTIIDWKTGRSMSDDVSMQLSCYAMYAMEKWGVDPEKVKLIEYNLLANQGSEFNVSATEIENTKAYMAGSIADMQSLLVDVYENVTKGEDVFQKVEDDRIRARCNFKKVCD
jgi:CRISPR/Cas system-associated exonuclease Cas4 (RecB family)